ncbi:MAG: DUF1905 domain-containing protein [Flavobacteriales bacterium]|nr:DUF1905 domain-containing protein [Flavobacteriales bacterium]
MQHSFEGTIAYFDSNVWNRHIDVPDDIVQWFKTRKITRVLCTIEGKLTKHCALLSHGNGTYFVMLNKEEVKKLGLEVATQVNLTLEEDKSKYGMPIPEEMEELLRQDPEADKYFHGLTAGKQRSLLFIIGKPKGSETRLKKAIAICEYLKSTGGALDFREMNQALKDSRFKL